MRAATKFRQRFEKAVRRALIAIGVTTGAVALAAVGAVVWRRRTARKT